VVGLAHIILHTTLCSGATRTAPKAPFALHLRLTDRICTKIVDQTVQIQPEDAAGPRIEFDAPRGSFRLELDVPQYKCSAVDFLVFMPDSIREINETFIDGPPTDPKWKPLLLFGQAPMSFAYVKPTFVLFDKSVDCDKPVNTPIDAHIAVEYDRGGYYVQIFYDPALEPQEPLTMALRLRAPTGLYHYLRVPKVDVKPYTGWPQVIQLDVTEDDIDGVSTEKFDTLLCPKFRRTSVQ
jgi:hypothetical protein